MKTQRTILSPSEFAWFQLGMKSLYDWQIEVLEAIGLQEHGGPPVAVAAANGSGKTSNIVAPAIDWFLSKYPQGQVVVTSGSFRQVEKQLWLALRVESEDKTRAEGRHSPDRGDALLGCIVCGSRLSGAVTAREVDAAEVGHSDFAGPAVGGW